MADLTQTPANVESGEHDQTSRVQAGAAITAGDVVYSDPADSGKWKPADTTDAVTANALGMAITKCADDAYFTVMKFTRGRKFNPGATVAVGEMYGVSANAGKFAPIGDWTTGDFMTTIGVGVSTSEIMVVLQATGAQHP